MQHIRIAKTTRILTTSLATSLCLCLAVALTPRSSHATPYASAINITVTGGTTTNVSFYLNEAGGNVTVTYEDGTTNASFNGITTGLNLPAGQQTFTLNGHSSYSISVFKVGNGTPFQISTDNQTFTSWPTPRGVAANSNPKIGSTFGRVYVAHSAVSGGKGRGLYALNPDLTEALGHGTTATGTGAFVGSTSSPWRIRVAPDNTLLVDDFNNGNANILLFAPDLTSSNRIFVTGLNFPVHGACVGTPKITGSLATGDLVLWVADDNMPVPSASAAPSLVLGPGTSRGSYNVLYRYDIGAGPLPWTQPPNYAYTVGLDGLNLGLTLDLDIGKDGKIFGLFERFNLSNPNIQELDPTGANLIWSSWQDTGGASDPWSGLVNGFNTPSNPADDGAYAGVRVSPDGVYLASVAVDDDVTIANLTNGVPDDSTLFGILNTPNIGNSRGMDWDAADNIYIVCSGDTYLRTISLNNTATCVTSNDITGTNGTFQLIVPPITASVVATTNTTSQGHGSPTPGNFAITLNTNILTAPVTVAFTLGGTAVYPVNYTIGTGTDPNGVVITSTNVTFPIGTYPSGNWAVNIPITATATPQSGPTLTVLMTAQGGANYRAGRPAKDTISIINTGPQVLFLSPAGAPTMSRSVPNDYAQFIVTRWGDLTVPSYTVTNITYLGTASYPADYTAQSQNFTGSVLNNGAPGFTINPGDIMITNAIGNPVAHPVNATPNNVTIIISLTNSTTGTNATASNGFNYSVGTDAVTLTELDNAEGNEVVIWSDPLTNSADSTNWTLTFDSESLFNNQSVLPVLIPNYTNDETSLYQSGGTNDFHVQFGNPVANDSINPSPTMQANGWTTALRMTVNKNNGSVAAANVFPTGITNFGNYALRFNMYLSIWQNAIGNINAGTTPREFALFGVDHNGTNCDWRPAVPIQANTYNGPTNADGVWFAIDAGDGSATPADFDAFTSPTLPNAGVSADIVSSNGIQELGLFKDPPFTCESTQGGSPVNQWVDVSVEISGQTNCSLFMNRSLALQTFNILANNGVYTNGTIMLGYLDPVADESQEASAFAYYSNVRVVELSPYIYAQPASYIVFPGTNLTFTSSAYLATAPLTNTWYGTVNPPSAASTAVGPIQSNNANTTNLTSTPLSVNNVQAGTNYLSVFSDVAGSVTSIVARIDVITSVPTNVTAQAGGTVPLGGGLTISSPNLSGPAMPTFIWQKSGVNLANSARYGSTTNQINLTINNVQSADAGNYTVIVTNNAGSGFALPVTLTIVAASSPEITNTFVQGTNVVLQFTSPDGYDTTSSFTLQRSPVVQGPYTNVTKDTITGSSGSFQFTIPVTTNTLMFYRLLHN